MSANLRRCVAAEKAVYNLKPTSAVKSTTNCYPRLPRLPPKRRSLSIHRCTPAHPLPIAEHHQITNTCLEEAFRSTPQLQSAIGKKSESHPQPGHATTPTPAQVKCSCQHHMTAPRPHGCRKPALFRISPCSKHRPTLCRLRISRQTHVSHDQRLVNRACKMTCSMHSHETPTYQVRQPPRKR